jgi:hypothetical protein
MKEKAVVDRFEGAFAVLLIGENSRKVDIPRKMLPKGTKEGTWLQVEFEADTLKSAEIDPEEMAAAKKRIMDKLAALRRGDHRKE